MHFTAGTTYRKINLALHPTQQVKGETKPP